MGNSHSSSNSTGDEGLADTENGVAGGLDALPRELSLSGEVNKRGDRLLARLHILRGHVWINLDLPTLNPSELARNGARDLEI